MDGLISNILSNNYHFVAATEDNKVLLETFLPEVMEKYIQDLKISKEFLEIFIYCRKLSEKKFRLIDRLKFDKN